MSKETAIKLFEEKQMRTQWDAERIFLDSNSWIVVSFFIGNRVQVIRVKYKTFCLV